MDIERFEFDNGDIRWITIDGEQWAVLNDFCAYIGLSKNRAREYGQALSANCYADRVGVTDSLGRTRETYIINKRGIAYILRTSNKTIPKAFQQWLGTEVFDSIVNDGGYVAPWVTTQQLARIQEKIDYTLIRHALTKATDYDPQAPITRAFFSIAQNAFYRTVVGMSAQNIIESGRDIINYTGKRGPTKQDLQIAKNYLDTDELELLGMYVANAVAQTKLRFHRKQYTMDEYLDGIKDSMKSVWEK